MHECSQAPRCAAVRPLCALQAAVGAHAAHTTTKLGDAIRDQFPLLHQEVHGKPLVYLDNAATSQKPQVVLDAMATYYATYNSNVHRGVHALSAKATTEYEAARDKVAHLINASTSREIVFTRNATEAVNLVAYGWAGKNLKAGDEVRCHACSHREPAPPPSHVVAHGVHVRMCVFFDWPASGALQRSAPIRMRCCTCTASMPMLAAARCAGQGESQGPCCCDAQA